MQKKHLDLVGTYDPRDMTIIVDGDTFRSVMGEREFQLRLSEKANLVNDARQDLSESLDCPYTEPHEIEYLRQQYFSALDEATAWKLSLDDLAAALGVNLFRVRLEAA